MDQLPPELRETIEDLKLGDELVIEREGAVVARLKPTASGGGLLAFLEARRHAEPIDDEFEAAVLEAVRAGNKPIDVGPWE